MKDLLLFNATSNDDFQALMEWKSDQKGLHDFMPDAHRLFMERWIWDRRTEMVSQTLVIDVSAENPRRYLGPGYRTFGLRNCDMIGDLLNEKAFKANTVDTIICTEVLEHCTDPFKAVDHMFQWLKPGGRLLVTSPFFWPWHGTDEYEDYWRFTHQGWKLLLKQFERLEITTTPWTTEGSQVYDLMRRFECMGMRDRTTASTGYLCECFKPLPRRKR